MLHSKQQLIDCMMKMSEPLIPYFSEKKARLHLGDTGVYYNKATVSMEGISRLLWGFVPLFAGGHTDEKWQDIFRSALTEGTDPDSEEYWGDISGCDQRFVEMAAIAYGILFAREKIWDILDDNTKNNLAAYLYKINEYPLPECNWVLFAVLVNIALKSVGRKYSAEKLEEYLRLTESFYCGDGWYRDGDSYQKDYYISFAIHFYCLIYAKVMENDDPSRSQIFRERASVFAKQFIYWFDDTGEALPFGRSLTYRFAQVSFFSACVISETGPFSLGQLKGIITRHIENWLKKDIFDRDGILTIGYGYPNLIMAESYNAPGSPYWAFKTFAVLMLPDDHPFWTTESEPLPPLEPLSSQPFADKLMYHYKNHAAAFPVGIFSPAGHGQSIAKYGKLVYDTCFGFNIAKSSYSVYENAPDSMLAFEINGDCHVRRISLETKILADKTWSKWSPYPDITVETTIIPDEKGHTRYHRIISDMECTAYDTGFAVACRDEDNARSSVIGNTATAENVFSLCSVSGEGEAVMLYNPPNVNVLYRKTMMPAIKYIIRKGETIIETRVNAERFSLK
ncbi:MAG: DUF2264 domain-containing protein [Oscillospiraceae bacterium]|nr:DUF2264 domain-containing protein [Oscillospiraceae bacterium]